MNFICGIIGLIIGIVIFVLLLDKIHFLFADFFTLMLIFTVCVGIGCALAYFLGWIFIIIAIIGVIYLVFFDSSDDNSNKDDKEMTENNNEDKKE